MFEDNGSLSGEFIPSLYIDMYSGNISTNKFAETFAEYQYKLSYMSGNTPKETDLYANEVDFNKTYNIKFSDYNLRLLTMPQSNDINTIPVFPAQGDTKIDGLRSIVINRVDHSWEKCVRNTLNGATSGGTAGYWPFTSLSNAVLGIGQDDQRWSSSLLLCAIPELFHPYCWKIDNSGDYIKVENSILNDSNYGTTYNYFPGYFAINGTFSNFILLEPGAKVVLRSCRDTNSDQKLYWYVENSADFEEVPYEIYLKIKYAYNSTTSKLEQLTGGDSVYWQSIGYDYSGGSSIRRSCFVSKSLYKIYEYFGKKNDSSSTSTIPFRINIEMSELSGSYDITEENWSWEQCVSSINIVVP